MNIKQSFSNVLEALSSVGEISTDDKQDRGFVLEFPHISVGLDNKIMMEYTFRAYVESVDTGDVADVVDLVLSRIMELPDLSLSRPYTPESEQYVSVNRYTLYREQNEEIKGTVLNFEFCVEQSK